MILVQRNGILYGSTFCIFFLMLKLSNAVEQFDLLSESFGSINQTNVEVSHSRVKREHGSCVTGMAIDGAISAGSASALNAEANSGGGRGRGKRSIDEVESKAEVETVRNKRSPAKRLFLTRTQALFDRINHNFEFAQSFYQSQTVQSSNFLSSRIVLNHHAVTCHDLCSHYPGVRYGLVGFCTPDYCQCFNEKVSKGWGKGWEEDNSWIFIEAKGWDHVGKEKERSCNKKKVFDPVRLACRDPRLTELCSDRSAHGTGWTETHH